MNRQPRVHRRLAVEELEPRVAPATIFVDAGALGGSGTSWSSAYRDLQDALARAEAGDEIWVAEGVYKPAGPGGSIESTFHLVSEVSVYGGFAGTETSLDDRDWTLHETLLSGDLNGDDGPEFSNYEDNVLSVVHGSDFTVLDGFTITGGAREAMSSREPGRHPRGRSLEMDVANCTFSANAGSGLAYGVESSGTVTNCTFADNVEGMTNSGAQVLVMDCTFVRNRELGMFNCWEDDVRGHVTVAGCTFFQNGGKDGAYAGAMRNDCAVVIVRDCEFVENYVTWRWGAAMLNTGGHVSVSGCTFTANWGVAMDNWLWWEYESSITVTDCTFVGHRTGDNAGALHIEDGGSAGRAVVTGCSFIDNEASEGAGLWCFGTDLTVRDCEFVRNLGGAFRYDGGPDGPAVVDGCTFRENVSWDCCAGLEICNALSCTVTNCAFIGNEMWGDYGGSALIGGGNLTLTDCVFDGNWSASGPGGADVGGLVEPMTNCVFTGNRSGYDGGALRLCGNGDSVALANCTFTGNVAGGEGGAITVWPSEQLLELTNCIFWENHAGEGWDNVHNDDEYSETVFDHCMLQGCGGSGDGWDESLGIDGGGNLDADPLFFNVADPDGFDDEFGTLDDGLALLPASSAIDAGTPDGAPEEDLAGVSRPMGDGIDIGAYEGFRITRIGDSDDKPYDRKIDMGEVMADGPGGATATATVVIENPRPDDVTIFSIGLLGGVDFSLVDAPAAPVVLTSGDRLVLTVLFDPDTGGTKADALALDTNDPHYGFATVALTGNGLFVPDIRITDSVSPVDDLTVHAGLVMLDDLGHEPGAAEFTIENVGPDDLTVYGMTLSSGSNFLLPDAPTGSFVVAAGDSVTVTVLFDTEEAGAYTDTVTILSDDPDEPAIEITLVGGGITLDGANLDPTFGGGTVLSDVAPTEEPHYPEMLAQPDGKIVVGFCTDYGLGLARYNPDGTLDQSFDHFGFVIPWVLWTDGENVCSLALQEDGKIIAAGGPGLKEGITLARFNADGSLDATFGSHGLVGVDLDDAETLAGVAMAPDGKIVVACTVSNRYPLPWDFSDILVMRLNTDGSLDGTFGTDGMVATDLGGLDGEARGVAVQEDGKIVVIACDTATEEERDFVVLRYDVNGDLDTSFGDAGIATTDFDGDRDEALSLAVQQDGRIVVAGMATVGGSQDFAVACYTADGSLDAGFGVGGTAALDLGGSESAGTLAVDDSGRIVIAGDMPDSLSFGRGATAVVAYTEDGLLDSSFDEDGVVITEPDADVSSGPSHAACFTPDGKVVVVAERYTGPLGDRDCDYDVSMYYYYAVPEITVTESDAPGDDLVIDMGYVLPDGPGGDAATATITIANEGRARLTVESVSFADGTAFSLLDAPTEPIVIDPEDSVTLTVVLDPATAGLKTDTITIVSTDRDEEIVQVALSGIGIGDPEIRVTDSDAPVDDLTVDAGVVVVDGPGGDWATQTVTVQNLGGSDLTVSSFTILSGTDFALVDAPSGPVSLAPRDSMAVTVRFDATSFGAKTDTLRILSDDPDEGTVDVTLQGEGMAPLVLSATNPIVRYTDADGDQIMLMFFGTGEAWIATTNGASPEVDPNADIGYVGFRHTTTATLIVQDLDPWGTPNTMVLGTVETMGGASLNMMQFINTSGSLQNTSIDINGGLSYLYGLTDLDNVQIHVSGPTTMALFTGAITDCDVQLDGGAAMLLTYKPVTGSTIATTNSGITTLYLMGGITGASSVSIAGDVTTFFAMNGVTGTTTIDIAGQVGTALLYGPYGGQSVSSDATVRLGRLKWSMVTYGAVAGRIQFVDTAAGSSTTMIGDLLSGGELTVLGSTGMFGSITLIGRLDGDLTAPEPGINNRLYVTGGGDGTITPVDAFASISGMS